jgi:hypothetical protein
VPILPAGSDMTSDSFRYANRMLIFELVPTAGNEGNGAGGSRGGAPTCAYADSAILRALVILSQRLSACCSSHASTASLRYRTCRPTDSQLARHRDTASGTEYGQGMPNISETSVNDINLSPDCSVMIIFSLDRCSGVHFLTA